MTKELSRLALVVAFVVAVAGAASASPIGPVYPAPGGSTLAPPLIGEFAGSAGGRTFVFTGLDTSAYTDLYWGIWDGLWPGAAFDGNIDASEKLSFSSFDGTKLTFLGTALWNDPTPPIASGFYQTKLEITIVGGGTWVSALSLGLNPNLGYLVDVSGNSFTTNILFSANVGSGFQPINSVQQLPGNDSKTKTSFNGAFYSTVPDGGGTLILLSLAMAGLATAKRKFEY